MDITSHGIVDIKGCQHSKHVSILLFQTELFFQNSRKDVFDRNMK